jgi:hypothetical protein
MPVPVPLVQPVPVPVPVVQPVPVPVPVSVPVPVPVVQPVPVPVTLMLYFLSFFVFSYHVLLSYQLLLVFFEWECVVWKKIWWLQVGGGFVEEEEELKDSLGWGRRRGRKKKCGGREGGRGKEGNWTIYFPDGTFIVSNFVFNLVILIRLNV